MSKRKKNSITIENPLTRTQWLALAVGMAVIALVMVVSKPVDAQFEDGVTGNFFTGHFNISNSSLADLFKNLVGNVETKLGAAAGPDHYFAETFHAGFTRGSRYASTTPTSITIPENKLVNYDFIEYYPTTGAVTLTFAASTSYHNLVPNVGDTQETCVYNALSNVITFAAGTGIDLEVASTSLSAPLALQATRGGCFTFMRLANLTASSSPGDILTFFEQYNEAD